MGTIEPATGNLILHMCDAYVFLEPTYYMENSHKGVRTSLYKLLSQDKLTKAFSHCCGLH